MSLTQTYFFNPLNDGDPKSTFKYYSLEDFKQVNVNRITTLTVVHLSVRSFEAKIDNFQALFNCYNLVPDVLILSEKWFTHDNPCDLNGYIAQHGTRPNGRGGSMSVFVHNTIKSFFKSHLSYNSN